MISRKHFIHKVQHNGTLRYNMFDLSQKAKSKLLKSIFYRVIFKVCFFKIHITMHAIFAIFVMQCM